MGMRSRRLQFATLLMLAVAFAPTASPFQGAAAPAASRATGTRAGICTRDDDDRAGVSGRSDGRGTIVLGCPKVWRSDRVFTVLDGILRDVDSITVKALQDLDPNEINATDLQSLVTDFQLSLKYDQGAAINNQLKLQQIQQVRTAELQTFQRQQRSNDVLLARRDLLEKEALELQKRELELVKADKPDAAALKSLREEQDTVQKQIADIDKMKATPAISDQSLSSTSATTPPDLAAARPFDALPADYKSALRDALKTPALPATMRMDNVIELLHQRLVREFAVMQDDLARQSATHDLYLVQFDVGIMPAAGAKNRQAEVRLRFTDSQVRAYELYPSASAYNTLRGMDKTTRIGLSGMFQTIIGYGLSTSFNRTRNELQSGLSQSLYVSGFGAGSSKFGWRIGPAPFETYVNPGSRTVQALLLVPKAQGGSQQTLKMKVQYCWPGRETRFFSATSNDDCDNEEHTIEFTLPGEPQLTLRAISYRPSELQEGATGPPKPGEEVNTLQLTFNEAIDPNLIITSNSTIIRRVRDVRGRALYAASAEKILGNTKEQGVFDASRFGLLEQDELKPNTWFAIDSHTIIITLDRAGAGTDLFPIIRLSNPGGEGKELRELVTDLVKSSPRKPLPVRIGEWAKFQNSGSDDEEWPDSIFQPLFTKPYSWSTIGAYVEAYLGPPENKSIIRIVSKTRSEDRLVPLHSQAQIVVETTGKNAVDWALDCDEEDGTMLCVLPKKALETNGGAPLKIWVDQAPYFEKGGLWASATVKYPTLIEHYAFSDWSAVQEICTSTPECKDRLWNAWVATIHVKTYDVQYCVDTRQFAEGILQQTGKKGRGKATLPMQYSFGGNGVQTECGKSPIQATITRDQNDTVKLLIPFKYFSALPDELNLITAGCFDRKNGSCQPPITLPSLRASLLPGNVKYTDLGNDSYRLEGDRLRAVSAVKLEGAGRAIPVDSWVGYNNVDFALPAGKKKLKAGKYAVLLEIGGTTVPARTLDEKKSVQPIMIDVVDRARETKSKAAVDAKAKAAAKAKAEEDARAKTKPEKTKK
jgi:hypothetical protein